MKLHLLNRSGGTDSTFTITRNKYPYFLNFWHYHAELELVLIEKSTGTRFIGDSIQKFEAGEVVLLGKNLPHMWLNDDKYIKDNLPGSAEAIALHFKEYFLGKEFLKASEFSHISQLLKLSQRGIKFQHPDEQVRQSIRELLVLDGFPRTMAFIELLDQLARHKEHELLSSIGYIANFQQIENEVLTKVYKYIFDNFKSDVSLGMAAGQIGMNPSAFSRFFKRIHRKPFTRYLNEIRVGYACKLLLEGENNIAGAAYDSGFNNISNFNRQFRAIKNMSPTDYIKSYKRTG